MASTISGQVGTLPYQLVYIPSRFWKWLFLGTAAVVLLMLGYLVAFTPAPLAAIVLLFVIFGPPIAVLLWLSRRAGNRTVWEVTETRYLQIAAGRVVSETALEDIGSVAASGPSGATCSLLIRDRSGRVVSRLISGATLTCEDLQFLFGALHAAIVGVSALQVKFSAPDSGWPESAPDVEKRWAGRRPGLWGEYHAQLFVAPSVIMTALGVILASLGLMRSLTVPLIVGILLFVAGATLLFFSHRYLEMRMKEGRLEF